MANYYMCVNWQKTGYLNTFPQSKFENIPHKITFYASKDRNGKARKW
eukprot:UN00015